MPLSSLGAVVLLYIFFFLKTGEASNRRPESLNEGVTVQERARARGGKGTALGECWGEVLGACIGECYTGMGEKGGE